MMEWLFKLGMYLLVIIVVAGTIFLVAWQIAKVIVILIILTPFAALIVWKVNKKINTAPVKGASHVRTQSRQRR